MARVDVRKGMPSVELSREEFEKRYRSRFADPAFEPLQQTRNAARALDNAVNLSRTGIYQRPDDDIDDPNPE